MKKPPTLSRILSVLSGIDFEKIKLSSSLSSETSSSSKSDSSNAPLSSTSSSGSDRDDGEDIYSSRPQTPVYSSDGESLPRTPKIRTRPTRPQIISPDPTPIKKSLNHRFLNIDDKGEVEKDDDLGFDGDGHLEISHRAASSPTVSSTNKSTTTTTLSLFRYQEVQQNKSEKAYHLKLKMQKARLLRLKTDVRERKSGMGVYHTNSFQVLKHHRLEKEHQYLQVSCEWRL